MTPLIALPDRAVLRLQGVDTRTFLQGIITADAREVRAGAVVYSALLTPQGKMLADFFLHAEGEDILLETEAARLPDLLARLKMYKLRAKVTITDESTLWHSAASLGLAPLPHDVIGGPDPRAAGFGLRLLLPLEPALWAEAHRFALTDFATYDQARMQHFLPDGSRDYIPEKSFPLELGLDHLGAIDFDKGCYIGQEVTNTQKRRLARRKALGWLEADGPVAPAPVMAGEKEMGQLRSINGHRAMALLSIDDTRQAGEIRVGDRMVQAHLPSWAQNLL